MSIPDSWLPQVKMTRIIVHWTAGGNTANATDKRHYHIIVNGNGTLTRGIHSINSNRAAHTRNLNTGSIGIAMAGMVGARERPFNAGRSPINAQQWNAMTRAVKQLANFYRIPISRERVLTHAEVQGTLGVAQRGKWDIAILPFATSFNTPRAVGDRMRAEIKRVVR